MAISMTGFGRGEGKGQRYTFTVEVRTVNNRYLDISIKTPRKIIFLEDWIRQQIKKQILRGRVEMFIKMETQNVSDAEISLDINLARSYHDILQQIRHELQVKDDVSVMGIARFPEVVRSAESDLDQEEVMSALGDAIKEAVASLMTMRSKEGQELVEDIQSRTLVLEEKINDVQRNADLIESEYRTKIKNRMDEILKTWGYEAEEQRILQEAAIFADRSSVTEEIVRFKVHIGQLRETLAAKDAIGRKLDFLLQEMNREVNTIGSKTTDIQVTSLVVDLKSELEKIREQVQNIE